LRCLEKAYDKDLLAPGFPAEKVEHELEEPGQKSKKTLVNRR
jgi:hypothetical protein